MTTTQAIERTVQVTVKEAAKQAAHGNFPADFKLTVTSPWFKSKQATIIFVPLEVGQDIEPGATLSMVIRSEGLKDNPKGGPYDGQLPWMYRWGFVRLATKDDIGPSNGSAPTPHPSPLPHEGEAAAAARKAAALARDPQRDSIERQTALIQATLLAANGVLIPDGSADMPATVTQAAETFIAWLQGIPVEAPRSDADASEAAEPTPKPATDPEEQPGADTAF